MEISLFSYLLTILFIDYVRSAAVRDRNVPTDQCDSKIYCEGDLLKTIQLANTFPDSKTFVDHYQLQDPDVTLANFKVFMDKHNNKPNATEVAKFVNENFALEDEILPWMPPDWQEKPPILKTIENDEYRAWANKLNQIWKTLARNISDNVMKHPERHSIIPVPNGFVVPGGRFQEFYYWDSYWVLEGLLLSGMTDTAKGMIENFLSMVRRYGFVPNGGRVYYLMRSQPPLLIPMVEKYLEFVDDYNFLKDNLYLLEKEFSFFQQYKTVDVKKNGKIYTMARYVVDSKGPRPESYREDYKLGQAFNDDSTRQNFYNNMKAGAESGWDFSSRWFIPRDGLHTGNLTDIETSSIIPVDLNAYLQRNAALLSKFNEMLDFPEKAKYYSNIAKRLQIAIDEVLWNEQDEMWLDYDMKNEISRRKFFPTNLTPLYTNSFNESRREYYAEKAVKYLLFENINSYAAGIPTSLAATGEQWDLPNAWPPLQSIIVQGLRNTKSKLAISMAWELASKWLNSNYMAFRDSDKMFEKYDAAVPGKHGGGGEYEVQPGFGWTNGVVLEFLDSFPDMSPYDNDRLKYDIENNNNDVIHHFNQQPEVKMTN